MSDIVWFCIMFAIGLALGIILSLTTAVLFISVIML